MMPTPNEWITAGIFVVDVACVLWLVWFAHYLWKDRNNNCGEDELNRAELQERFDDSDISNELREIADNGYPMTNTRQGERME